MKKSIFIFIILLLLFACATPPTNKTYTPLEIIKPVPGMMKDEIYEQSKIFIAQNFRSAKAVIEYDNKEQGTLIGNGNVKYPCGNFFTCGALKNVRITFQMRIDVKNEKIRITFNNILAYFPPRAGQRYPAYVPPSEGSERPLSDEEYNDSKPKLIELAHSLIESLKGSGKKESW